MKNKAVKKHKRDFVVLVVIAFAIGFPLGIFIASHQVDIKLDGKGIAIVFLAVAVLTIIPTCAAYLLSKIRK